MTKLSELGPVDASTANIFNPRDQTGKPVSISVEDVRSYFSLAKDSGLKSETAMVEAFKILASQVNSIALGNIQRVFSTSADDIPRLLKLHMNEQDKIKKITEELSQKYTHDYAFTREHAREIGLPVMKDDPQLETLLWDLYELYETDLLLLTPFSPQVQPGQTQSTFSHETAYIESDDRTDAFIQEGTISPPQPAQQIQNLIPGVPMPQPQPQQAIPGLPVVKFTKQAWVDVTPKP